MLLSDLSSLVKAAKRIPEYAINNPHDSITAEDIIDEMVLRTFKIVVRGVGFLDSWYEELQSNLEDILLYGGDECSPPTPPSESVSPSVSSSSASLIVSTDRHHVSARDNQFCRPYSSVTPEPTENSLSDASRNPNTCLPYENPSGSPAVNGKPEPVFALARLNTTYDILLSYLASYIGRLQLQSRSPSEIHRNTKQ